MIKKLNAFDFDGTLINSPEKDNGIKLWSKLKGIQYPYQGWWGRVESLDLTIFDIKPFPNVLSALNNAIKDDDSLVIVLTSRREKLRPSLQAILDINMINVDKLDMKTIELTKGERILKYVEKYPELKEINVYDDKDSDIDSYKQIISSIPQDIVFNIYRANNGKLTLVGTNENSLLSIINEEIEKILTDTQFYDNEILNNNVDIYHGGDLNNIKNLIKNPVILSPEEKRLIPSNTGGNLIGLSTSLDIYNARKYSNGFGHNKILHLQLLKGANVLKVDTEGKGIDDIFTGIDLEKLQNKGFDAIIETDDLAEKEVRLLSMKKIKILDIL